MEWKKYVYTGIGLVLISWFLFNSVYDSGFDAGKAEVLTEWNNEKIKYLNSIDELKTRLALKEQEYRSNHTKILLQLKEAKKDYEIKLSNISHSHAIRMLNLRKRIKRYQHQSESGAIERRNLADHAARLDKAVTDGIRVVEELQAHIELRNEEIKKLGSIIQNDRSLLEK